MSIYLDYNASTPIEPKVLEHMVNVYKTSFGNSDSRTHDYGDKARKVVEEARKQVASLLGCMASEVFFTSGATESNNIAILGLREFAEKTSKKHIITTAIEHKAIIEAVKHLEKQGFNVEYIFPKEDGCIDAEEIIDKVRDDTLLVSVMHANNETGSIQPVYKIGEKLKEKNILFHVDATQTCGKLVDELRELQYDMLSLSAHKMNGPQGVGAIILRRKKYKLPPVKPIMFGGQQEHGLRPGTVPVALVAGLGLSCDLALKNNKEDIKKCNKIKTSLIRSLQNSGLDYKINGSVEKSMPNTLNVCIKGVASEALMLATKEYCSISNGSACTSSNYTPSHVLASMGLTNEEILSSIRISWSAKQDEQDIIDGFKMVLKIAKEMV